jgi:3,4-dihydroxy 2-butanone 4-phosphate synthase/GTP cyclohydrolase II
MYPAGVLVEILNPDGSMARLPQLMEVAKQFDLKIISIDDLVAYRMRTERLIRRELELTIKSVFGEFEAITYVDNTSGDTHLVLKKGAWNEDEPVLVRVHSSSETGDFLGILLDDYGTKINNALRRIQQEGKGAFVYLRQNDKSGMLNKLQLYKQFADDGELDKFKLHSPMDNKDFGVGAQILRDLGITKIRLLTSHPRPRTGLIGYGLEVVENLPLA